MVCKILDLDKNSRLIVPLRSILQGDIQRMMPADVGAAAAYKVWRNWKYHYGIYGQPLGGDRERQREALVGLAVGEGTSISGEIFPIND